MGSSSKSARKPARGSAGVSASPEVIRKAMYARAMRQAAASGKLTFPAVPALRDHYVQVCGSIFAALGRPFDESQLENARKIFGEQLDRAFVASSRSSIVVSYEAPRLKSLDYKVWTQVSSIAREYEGWVKDGQDTVFGTHPDARIVAAAESLGEPSTVPVLDIGAGQGRNALPLARRGHPVDAVELTPALAQGMRNQAAQEGLNVRIIEGELSASEGELREGYGLVFLSEVTTDFRGAEQLRRLTSLAARILRPGGLLVMNIFLPEGGYTPERAARELGQQLFASIFTRAELAQALDGLGLPIVDDVSVYEYERKHLPAGAYPPTSWYEDWIRGKDVYDMPNPPVELRWITCRKA